MNELTVVKMSLTICAITSIENFLDQLKCLYKQNPIVKNNEVLCFERAYNINH